MKDFVKTITLIGLAFGAGYLYSEYKDGKDFEIDNDWITIKTKHFNSVSESIENALSSLDKND